MTSEELAPSSLKKRRIERQEKYFKEQVLMKDEAKIIAKTHKGEAILTVDKDTSNDDYFLTSGILEKTGNEKENAAYEKNDNNSDKASGNYESDEERKIDDINKVNNLSRENSSVKNLSSLIKSNSIYKGESNLRKSNESTKNIIKYKNLSQDMLNFFNLLQEFKREGLFFKLNDKLKTNLKPETYQEILKRREEEKYNK
jgi:hypothetical protein